MNARRGFLALVGGLAVGGPVISRASFAQPTLILPPGPTILPTPIPAEPLLTLQHIQQSVPEDAFKSWMFLGLRRPGRASRAIGNRGRRRQARQHHRGDAGRCDMTDEVIYLAQLAPTLAETPHDPDLSGVVGLTALMQAARSSGVISDFREQSSPCALRPDAELISACREYLGCDRIASKMREVTADSWEDQPAFRTQMDRLSDAVRERNRLLPQVLELPAKTHEGVAMKARVIGAIFADKNGLRSAAVRSLTDDIAAVMGEQPC